MGQIGVAEAARRLGVGVARIHQRIADGSLPATRVGSQWIIDEAALSPVAESKVPGRPLSQRSAWALVAASQGNQRILAVLAPAERSRARDRLRRLLASSSTAAATSEAQVRGVASLLRSWLRNRAERRLYRASPRDLPDLREDDRITLSGISHSHSGIASGDLVEGYVDTDDLAAVVDDYLLSPVALGREANVVLHVASGELPTAVRGIALLTLAADLAEHRSPREEFRAVEVLREIVGQHPGPVADAQNSFHAHEKVQT